jgi:1-phosphofructokinase
MIVTLTANPSLDRSITLERPLVPGAVQAAAAAREDAGGKGINVSRVVAAAGVGTCAILPLAADDPYAAAVEASAVPTRRVAMAGHVRANVTITDPMGVTTKLNLPGAALDAESAQAVIAAVVDASAAARWLVLAGSLPPGAGDDFYVNVVRAVRAAHGPAAPRIAVDTSGEALRAVVEHAHPDLIKPNDDELADLVGAAIDPDDPDAIATIRSLAAQIVPAKAERALVTLGAHGALLIEADAAWQAAPPKIRVVSTVGAGDSSLAGYLLADVAGADAAERLRHAIRYGAAAASLPGTQAPTPGDLPAGDVVVTRLP